MKKEEGKKNQESSVITRSHLSSNIFTASVNSSSGGKAPVDSRVTRQTRETIQNQKQ